MGVDISGRKNVAIDDDTSGDCNITDKSDLLIRKSRDFNADRELLSAIFESTSDCILIWDKDYNYLYANQAAIDHVQTTPDKVIGRNIRDGLGHAPEFMKLWMSRIDTVFETGQTMRVTDKAPLGNRIVYSESVLSPIRSADGALFAVGVVYRDVTEHRSIERELAESEAKYRNLYDNAQVPLYRVRISDLKLLECNHAMAQLLGYSSKEECLAQYDTAVHYTSPEQQAALLERVKKEKDIAELETEILRRDGTSAFVKCSAKLFPEKGYIEGAATDITASVVLTNAEKKILTLIMQGKCNKDIAQLLKRSIRTIEDHRAHIMQKLGAENIVELVKLAQSLVFEPEK